LHCSLAASILDNCEIQLADCATLPRPTRIPENLSIRGLVWSVARLDRARGRTYSGCIPPFPRDTLGNETFAHLVRGISRERDTREAILHIRREKPTCRASIRDSRIKNAQRDHLFVYVTLSVTFYDSICDIAH
jgi:hypothetical protein